MRAAKSGSHTSGAHAAETRRERRPASSSGPPHASSRRFARTVAEKHAPGADPSNVVLVGHSSGAQAALRYAERYPVRGVVLVAATYSDLGDAHERAPGYYPQPRGGGGGEAAGEESNPYLFDAMREHCRHWHQFHSDDDPFIPLHEAERVRDGLGLSETYRMLPGRSHFFAYAPELLDAILSLC